MADADKWIVFDNWMKESNEESNVDTDTFAVLLFVVGLGTPPTDTGTTYTALGVTNEVAEAFGYLRGGQVEPVTRAESATGVFDFAMTNPVWNASGGAITARYAIIVDTTTDMLVAWSLLDSLPQDVSAPDGQSFIVDIETNGVYTETRQV